MILAHVIALNPTKQQEDFLLRACGVARYTWNWALDQAKKHYETTGKTVDFGELKKRWNREKPTWVYESPKDANQQPFTHLRRAYQRFFASLKAKKRVGAPKFKKRGEHDSFYLSNDKFAVEGKKIRLPLLGWVRMREALRFPGRVVSATVRRQAGRWFASVQVDAGEGYRRGTGQWRTECVGVDLGLTTAATLSTGEKLVGPKPLRGALRRLRRLQQSLARKKRGSRRRYEAKAQVAKLYSKVSAVRSDFLHKATTRLCRENQAVVVEDLNVRGMMANRRLARALSDIGFAEFRRQIEYKGILYGTAVVVADRWYPSTKLCSGCGTIKEEVGLGERVFRCAACGLEIDRDVNAALNLRTLGLRGSYARGQTGAGEAEMPHETGLGEPRTKQRGHSRALTT